MSEKVSIITVVYNNARTIEQTIRSVLSQTYQNIEYIVIDGGSTDGTVEIIRKYLDWIDIFISEKDEGLYYAMNKGIGLASGDIIGILNSDDKYIENAISLVIDHYKNRKADVLYGNALVVDSAVKSRMYIGSDIEELWYRMAIPHPATFVKRDIYVKYGIFDTQYQIAADYDLILRLYSNGVKFDHIDNTLTVFRSGGISTLKAWECNEETWQISMKYIQFCPKKEEYLTKIQEVYARKKFIKSWTENDKSIIYEFEKIINKSMQRKFAIFGAGARGVRCFQMLSASGASVEFFVDNDSKKWGQKLQGIPVLSPNKLCSYEGYVMIGSVLYEQAISLQLKELDSSLKVVLLSDLAQDWYDSNY